MVSFPAVPASGIFRLRCDEAFQAGDLHFDACVSCGLLRRRDFACPPDYTVKPRSTEKQLPSYRNDLLLAIASLAKKSDLIADIGSNDGTFLRLLRENGYTNTFGVEPAFALAELSRQGGLRVQSGYFGPEIVKTLLATYGDVRLAVCRHTLEHVPYPGKFVTAIRELLNPVAGVALLEVPDSSVITERFNFVELWDEHLHYFTRHSLGFLLSRHGLSVDQHQIFPHLDTRNLLAWVSVRGAKSAPPTAEPAGQGAAQWRTFSRKFQKFAARFRAEVATFGRPTYLIGASHPQCNFVNYLGIGDCLDFMIDDDPEKAGKFPPIRGRGARIITTEQFMACPNGGAVILTGFGYPGWTQRIVLAAAEKSMKIIDPQVFVEQ